MEEILNEIWKAAIRSGRSYLKTLQETTYFATARGKSYIDMAESFDEETSILILDGTVRGTATAGAASTITLAADDSQTAAGASGKPIYLTGGTGSVQLRQITSLDTATKIATVDSAWTTNPVSGTTYLIVSKTVPLEEISPVEIDESQPASEGMPTAFAKYKRQVVFDRPFDLSTYGIQVRHFLNIHQVDRSAAVYTRILRNWRNTLTEGLLWKAFESQGDDQDVKAKKDFIGSLEGLLQEEMSFGGEFSGFLSAR